ncbi:alpha/beta hydrolase [Corynebacterium epidermidicanis]|nr:alpha/beta hydrolase [Corynebacterium epidermidicanis]
MFAIAATPSLLPRDWQFQAVASGFSAASGYGLGVFLDWNWRNWGREVGAVFGHKFLRAFAFEEEYAALKQRLRFSERTKFRIEMSLLAAVLVWVAYISVSAVRWQSELHAYMGMPVHFGWEALGILPVGLGLWALVLLLVHWALDLGRFVARIAPERWTAAAHSIIAGVVALSLGLWLVDSVIPGTVIRTFEEGAAVANGEPDPSLSPPSNPHRSGSEYSFNRWDGLGAHGSRFISAGMTATEIEQVTGAPAKEPIRLFSGLKNGETPQIQADLLVAELHRTKAHERKAILISGTTGTGWVNPTAAQSFELLYGGDTAIVAMQYSNLPSPVQFISSKQLVHESGKALVDTVVAWRNSLAENQRPELYIFGESLGSTQGEGAFTGVRDITRQVDGVLWVGPPNSNELWASLSLRRDPGTREVAPEFGGGTTVRFAENSRQISGMLHDDAPWNRPRVLFIQHATDPIVWWSPNLLFEQPDWLKESPGIGRHPSMSWQPIVTFWQVTLDMANSVKVPDYYGHNYGTEVLDGMAAITGYEGDVELLREALQAN